ncbi:MAG: metal-dependent hydrolase [Lachnospiraceae bacterium]|nr:metal-dependent hydrolase [Lachnospiraceae bacterium]
MVIDFHTHMFPDAIAAKTIAHLEDNAKDDASAHTNGTLQGLKDSMKANHIDYSVVLPIVTRPKQFDSINEFAAKINGTDGIISFGSIHPENENIREKLEYIKSLGLKGVKLHPDYQNHFIDDAGYLEILRACIDLDLICSIHAGYDIGIPYPIHCPPDRMRMVLDELLQDCNKDSKIVLAHMGGYLQWELVEKCLAGQNVYLDMSFCKDVIDEAMLVRIIKKHGSDRILYATDSPWTDQGEMVEYVKNLPISEDDKENIFYKNAVRLLEMVIE